MQTRPAERREDINDYGVNQVPEAKASASTPSLHFPPALQDDAD
ncbi:MAG TPA: hypothetical protein VK714_10785 [Myxococcota bacterium]|nr:hypothetical protein [Myxococcota bacterium]